MIKKEELGVGNLIILQDENGYRFTSDAVILANFVSAKKTDIVVEFCLGSGIISTLICYKQNPKHIYGFEIQKNVYDLANQSLKQNNLQDKITYLHEDLKEFDKHIQKLSADIVVCNPPYKKISDGLLPEKEEIAISKTELKITLEEIILATKSVLKDGGKFYVCYEPSRLVELIYLLKQNKLEPKRMFFSHAKVESAPSCVFVECIKGARSELKLLPPLITHNDTGDYVAIIRNMFI